MTKERLYESIVQGVNRGTLRFASQDDISDSLKEELKGVDPSGLLMEIDPAKALGQVEQYANAIRHATGVTTEAIEQHSEASQWHERAVSLVSEIVTLGALSRAHFDSGDEITEEEVVSAIASIAQLVDRWCDG